MRRMILSRLLQAPLILLLVFTVTFTLAWVLPGNPLIGSEGKRPPREVEEAMKRQYNLHSPWAFARGYLTGIFLGTEGHPAPYFGPSFVKRDQTVNDILARSLPNSVSLGLAALILALVIGVGAGLLGAAFPGSTWDLSSLTIALLGVSLPTFVTGTILLVGFAMLLGWVPVGGWEWPDAGIFSREWLEQLQRVIRAMALPALTLSLAPAAYIARLTRLGLADVMSSDYIRTARAKGVSETNVLFHHALKVAFLPVLSFLGPAAAATLTGSFVVEQIFQIPGVGQEFTNAVLNKDQSVLLGIVLVYSLMLVLFNLLVDVAYAWIDPRIELA